MNYDYLADLLLPNISMAPEHFIKLYVKRDLPSEAEVTRYAPSPTGFQHLGSVFAALISERLAHQSGGIFYLRIEDTDKKREVTGAVEDILSTFKSFNINFDEGAVDYENEKGLFGPYRQSKRANIYQAFAKELLRKGLAYPCFCTEDDLAETRETQEELKVRTGCYGKWAVHRNLSFEEIKAKLDLNIPFVIRLKSPGNVEKRIICHDEIRGDISFPENDQDIILLKSDGIPTYHFAHVIDDYLMGTTIVIRGEEWLSSLPIHLQLFDILELTPPKYAHIPTIMKMDGKSKRKLSKRKDPEISIDYYKKEGYPFDSVIEYLLNLINSNYEEWRVANPKVPCTDFKIRLNKMSQSGALFDTMKLNDMSRNFIANMDSSTVYYQYFSWAKKFDKDMADLLIKHAEYSKKLFNIERGNEKQRKDFIKWSDIKSYIDYFYDELFKENKTLIFPVNITKEEAKDIILKYKAIYNHSDSKDIWFSKLKSFSESLGYSVDRKAFKKTPDKYKGQLSDIAAVIRIALTGKNNTPDLYEIMQVMGEKRVLDRLSL